MIHKPLALHTNAFQLEKHIEEINGKIVKDIELMEYQKNGNVIIKGHYNKRPIYFRKRITPKFRKKHVRFTMGKIKTPNKINRILTPVISDSYNRQQRQQESRKNKIATIERINNQIKTRKRRGKINT
jgi:hypothetical protein